MMYQHLLRRWTLATTSLLAAVAARSPEVALPFNAQVPLVARVAEPYAFRLSPSTFLSDGHGNLSYTLSKPPAWLNIDRDSGILFGTPGQGNDGANKFTVVANDDSGSASMPCEIVVSSDMAPQITGNTSAVLAAAGVLSGPETLALRSNDALDITFGKHLFREGSNQVTTYYATLADHTPLPSWLEFQENSVAFWGIAPKQTEQFQSWSISLIASDVVGFAGVVATFTLEVSPNQLSFESERTDVTVKAGTPFTIRASPRLDGQLLTHSQILSAVIEAPSWIRYQNETLEIVGTPPQGFHSQIVKISVTDVYGDVARESICLWEQDRSLLTGRTANISVTAGRPFTYTVSRSLFSESGVLVGMNLRAASPWLHYDQATMQLYGTPPVNTRSQTVMITIDATSLNPPRTDSQTFELKLNAALVGEVPTTTSFSSSLPLSPQSSSTHTIVLGTIGSSARPTKRSVATGVVVGAVIGSIALVALIVVTIILLCRHQQRKSSHSPGDLKISRPMQPVGLTAVTLSDGFAEPDIEKTAGVPDRPPRLHLPSRYSELEAPQPRYAGSLISSIGDGEATIQADPDIPEWGRESGNVHTPHHSYSAATELARNNSLASNERLSQFFRFSPRKRASKLLQSWQAQTRQGNTFETHSHDSMPSPSRRFGFKSGLSNTRDRTSGTSLNTHGTSILSASMSDFPEPPSSTLRDTSYSIPRLSIRKVNNRRSIRLVSRSDSIATDDRPLADKRQSFIRNRASSSTVSPLFASSRRSSNMRTDGPLATSMCGSLHHGRSSQQTESSNSSFLEPPARDPRRLTSKTNSLAANSSLRPGSTALQVMPSVAAPGHSRRSKTWGSSTSALSNLSEIEREHNPNQRPASTDPSSPDLAAQLALPRHSRSWVLPGEASPTPTPSTTTAASPRTRARDAARQKWARRLQRNSRGDLMSPSFAPSSPLLLAADSPREEPPVRLTHVAQHFGRRRRGQTGVQHDEATSQQHQQQQQGKQKHRGPEDRLSQLVSKDSMNGPLRRRPAVVETSEGQEQGQTRGGAAREEDIKDGNTGERMVVQLPACADASDATYAGSGAVAETTTHMEPQGLDRGKTLALERDASSSYSHSSSIGKAFI